MIDLREIRIGNYYQWPDGTVFKVTEESLQDHNFWENARDNIEAIIINNDLAIRIGFNYDNFNGLVFACIINNLHGICGLLINVNIFTNCKIYFFI